MDMICGEGKNAGDPVFILDGIMYFYVKWGRGILDVQNEHQPEGYLR